MYLKKFDGLRPTTYPHKSELYFEETSRERGRLDEGGMGEKKSLPMAQRDEMLFIHSRSGIDQSMQRVCRPKPRLGQDYVGTGGC